MNPVHAPPTPPAGRTQFLQFTARMLQDAWADAHAAFWERRARDFEWVLTGDRAVRPSVEQLRRRPDIAAIIAACRAKARLAFVAELEYRDTLRDLAAGAPTTPTAYTTDLEQQLRQAIDRGDRPAIAVLEALIDTLDNDPRSPAA